MVNLSVAIETTLRFLRHCDVVDPAFVADHLRFDAADQIVTRVTEAVPMASDDFIFARRFEGFEVVPEAGTLIGRDGDTEIRTPYDNCVMVMPARDIQAGLTAVRLGRLVD